MINMKKSMQTKQQKKNRDITQTVLDQSIGLVIVVNPKYTDKGESINFPNVGDVYKQLLVRFI